MLDYRYGDDFHLHNPWEPESEELVITYSNICLQRIYVKILTLIAFDFEIFTWQEYFYMIGNGINEATISLAVLNR